MYIDKRSRKWIKHLIRHDKHRVTFTNATRFYFAHNNSSQVFELIDNRQSTEKRKKLGIQKNRSSCSEGNQEIKPIIYCFLHNKPKKSSTFPEPNKMQVQFDKFRECHSKFFLHFSYCTNQQRMIPNK